MYKGIIDSLIEILNHDAFLNITVSDYIRKHNLSSHEKSVFTKIIYGVCDKKIYLDIGRVVYEDIKDNKDVSREVVEAKCSEITANTEEIARLEAEILKVKSIRVCENCKNEIDYSVEFCPKCGAKQPSNVEVKQEAPSAAEETPAEVNDVESNNN